MNKNGIDRNKILFLTKNRKDILSPSQVPEECFWLLAEIAPIHSEKIIHALKDFLVDGYTRREVCERHGISAGYLSVSVGRLQHASQIVAQLVPWYTQNDSAARK